MTARKNTTSSATGTYRYDKDQKKVVLVSSGVPKVASKGKKSAASELGPCGRERSFCQKGGCG